MRGARSKPRALVLLNGAPASGKSTIAQRWAAADSTVHVVDIDLIRGGLDLWPTEPEQAGRSARRLAIAEIRSVLDTGRQVVVPQFLARPDFIDELGRVATSCSAVFVECLLQLDRQQAIDGFLARARAPTTRAHLDADAMVDAVDPAAHLGQMFDDLARLVASRPATRIIESIRGNETETLRRVRDAVREV